MSSLLFIRHAETDLAGRFCGHADPELNQQGHAQAAMLAVSLSQEPIAAVYSSDLHRARQTAEVIALGRGLAVMARPDLREIDFGQWEGLRWEQIEARDPAGATAWVEGYPNLPTPSGEPFSAFERRVLEQVHTIVDSHRGLTAVVTHAGVLRVILSRLFGCSEQEAWAQTKSYCCVVRYADETIGERQ